ncbi:Protein CBR-TIN-9.1 [Caenorhabditis briggsae]|uniref:Mitochondrial import inner membrane translocase subunit Tim9 n=1 Tax=Caenorhabditis briggsae TaxID=6238 RepID=TIM9_CAEBR|nr:Protein CBR-TIN-9.1 [Caenorhabditis briggsae]Q61TH2.1 RecName: Full=Mitochondrial import inner membrane translocase subunit Tim9 [Caenorhabditis briggsae]CAP26564.1 Protein CBR-TIN-9.1 [Caenorhabditis briggsae]
MASEQNIQTFRDFLTQYNLVAEQCFTSCVNEFGSRTVNAKEESCANNCLDKFLKMTQRVSQRFQEHQILNAQANGAAM